MQDGRMALMELLIGTVFCFIIIFAAINIGAFVQDSINKDLAKTNSTESTNNTQIKNTVTNISQLFGENSAILSIFPTIIMLTIPLIVIMFLRRSFGSDDFDLGGYGGSSPSETNDTEIREPSVATIGEPQHKEKQKPKVKEYEYDGMERWKILKETEKGRKKK